MNIQALNYFIAALLTALTTFFLAIFVYLRNPRSKLYRIFALYTLSISVWSLPYAFMANVSTERAARILGHGFHFGVVFICTFFLHFVFVLLNESKHRRRLILFPAYGLSILFVILVPTKFFVSGVVPKFGLNYFVNPGPVYYPFLVFWVSCITYGIYRLFKEYRISTGARRNQLKLLFLGSFIGYIGGPANFLLVFDIKYPLYPFGTYAVPTYAFLTAYAITRYHLMDINVVFKRTMAYSLSAGLLMAFFVVLVLSITNLLSAYAEVDSFKISIFAAIVIALLFNPIRNRMQILVDKIFYKKTYDYYATIQKVSHELASMFGFKKIYSFVGDIIFSTLGLKSIYLLSAVEGGGYEVVYSRLFGKDEGRKEDGKREKEEGGENVVAIRSREKELKIGRDSEMVKLLRTSDDIVIKDELPAVVEILGQETIDNITSTLKPFNGEAVMPVFVDNKLELLLILGEKLSGDIFTDEDVNLLGTVSHEAAIAIKNARLYKEKVLSERLASVGMMSATFAHEIRNPLTSIKTFAQLIPEKYTDAEFRETFSKIVVDEIARIDGLIKDLMDFSSSKALPCLDNVDITALVDEILEYIKDRLELEKKNISVEKIYKNVKINILGDSKKLKQAFFNIITNSCQAMNEKGVLKVNINSNGRDVNVKIIDMGEGISYEDITRVFDPFYTTKSMGVGLGLAISKKIIEDHGGRIAVESELSKGTTFTISLPVQNT